MDTLNLNYKDWILLQKSIESNELIDCDTHLFYSNNYYLFKIGLSYHETQLPDNNGGMTLRFKIINPHKWMLAKIKYGFD